jgi:hypothetical protein
MQPYEQDGQLLKNAKQCQQELQITRRTKILFLLLL